MPGWDSLTTLTQNKSDVNQSVYTTAAVSPSASKVIYLAFARNLTGGTSTAPVVAGCGLTWVLEEYVSGSNSDSPPNQRQNHTDLHVLYLFKAWTGTSPSSGPITITFPVNAFNCAWAVWEVGGIGLGVAQKVRLNNGSELGPGTFTNTLGAFASANNGTFGIFAGLGSTGSPTATVGSGFTEIAKQQFQASPTSDGGIALLVQGKTTNDTTVDNTWTTILQFTCGIAWEADYTAVAGAFMLTYIGEGHMIHLVEDDVPQCSADYGVTWQSATPPATYTECYSIAVDAEGDRVWGLFYKDPGGASTSAICYSTDGGLTWTVSLEVPSAFTTFTRSIACHPSDKNRIAVVGNLSLAARTWTTIDRGLNWTAKAGPSLNNGLIWPDPTQDLRTAWITYSPYGRLIISTGGDNPDPNHDLYYSDDAGTTWTQSLLSGTSPQTTPMTHLFRVGAFGPYFALWRNKGDEGATTTPLYRSDDHGVHWVPVPPPTAADTFYQSLGYDPLTNTLFMSARNDPLVYGLSPASDGDWSDMTFNFASPGNTGSPLQALVFVGDPASA